MNTLPIFYRFTKLNIIVFNIQYSCHRFRATMFIFKAKYCSKPMIRVYISDMFLI